MMSRIVYHDGLVIHYNHETQTYDVEELEPINKERNN